MHSVLLSLACVRHKLVTYAESFNLSFEPKSGVIRKLTHGGPKSTGDGVIFDCTHKRILGQFLSEKVLVEWLREAGINYCARDVVLGGKGICRFKGVSDDGAKAYQERVAAASNNFPLAERELLVMLIHRNACSIAARVSYGDRGIKFVRRVEHVPELVFILRGHYRHTRYGAQIRNVKHSLVGLSVVSNNTTSIDGKRHREILDADIVNDLIVGPLKESGIDRHNRF
jgi:hypothetical protein